ncbi:MAG: FAD binding domain-containing protein, partial [Sphaerochaetaceae bacterium]|nr:FAD binding domain-containing protein [Sphaerochaetaceae bacterium]
MKNFAYKRVITIDEALAVLNNDNSKLIAGGTDLLLKIKHGMAVVKTMVDISQIENFSYIQEDSDMIHIGAGTKIKDLIDSDLIHSSAPLIAQIAQEIGSPEIRNVATVGGNICAARANCGTCFLPGCKAMTGDRTVKPCQNASYSDLLLPFAAYDAVAVIRSSDGTRKVQMENFIKPDGKIDITNKEILTEIFFKQEASKKAYMCLRYPKSMGLPYFSVIADFKGGEKFDLTIGGATKSIYKFRGVSREDVTVSLVDKFVF